MKIKNGDFAKIQYTGKIPEGTVFDTTIEKKAKEIGMDHTHAHNDAVTICLGEGHVIVGLDKRLNDAEVQKDYTFTIPPEEGFGKKDAKLIQLMQTNRFRREDITPEPGLRVNVDDQIGIIKSVSGGRTLVDFNHPLAGIELTYEVKVLSKVDDVQEKAKCVMENTFHLHNPNLTVKEGTLTVIIPGDVPKDVKEVIETKVKSLVKEITKVTFEKPETEKKSKQ